MDFVFKLSSYDSPDIEEETARLLDRRLEAYGRNVMPGLWAMTDRINQNRRYAAEWPNQQRTAKRYRFYGALMLGLGIFMLVPGLMEPRKLLVVLLGGILAIISGIAYFRRAKSLSNATGLSGQPHSRQAQTSRKAAGELLERLRSLDLEKTPAAVQFDQDGIAVTEAEQRKVLVSYDGITDIYEEEHIWLLTYGKDRVLLLQKKDLSVGDAEDFLDYVQERKMSH